MTDTPLVDAAALEFGLDRLFDLLGAGGDAARPHANADLLVAGSLLGGLFGPDTVAKFAQFLRRGDDLAHIFSLVLELESCLQAKSADHEYMVPGGAPTGLYVLSGGGVGEAAIAR